MDYRQWFSPNILIPKAKIKTNVEFSGLFYLCHLISFDDLDLHIPYIIIRHMRTAANNSQHSLPYAHVIHRILSSKSIDTQADNQLYIPVHLCNELTMWDGYTKGYMGSNILFQMTDPLTIGWATNTLPNRYWDPSTEGDFGDVWVSSSAQGESSKS